MNQPLSVTTDTDTDTDPDNTDPIYSKSQLEEFNHYFEDLHPDHVLLWAYESFGPKAVLGTGFGPSGVFLIHRLKVLGLVIPVFYLDTQLLFEETYELRDRLERQLGISIFQVTPDLSVDAQAGIYGDELWKRDPDHCCYIRKVAPLQSYLSDKKAWITGIRRHQAATRKDVQIVETDKATRTVKINPVAAWSSEEIWDYIRDYNLPYNPLHDEGYPSIGCIPCTSPVLKGEDERNGRWRGSNKLECGIHFSESTGKFEKRT